MRSNSGHDYDEALLASAPIPTTAQKQGGYDPDILSDAEKKQTSSSILARDPERGVAAIPQERSQVSLVQKPNTPFWRTTKGIFIIIILICVIIAAVVGGAVGGTRRKGNSNITGGDSSGQGNVSDSKSQVITSSSGSPTSQSAATQGGNVPPPIQT